MSGLLVCYDVSSGSDESGAEDVEFDVKPKLEPVEYTGIQVANQVLDEILSVVTSGQRDFSDMYIKEEPMEPDEVKEEFDTDYRDSIKVELDSDEYDSDSSGCSESSVEVTLSKASEDSCKEAPPKTKNELGMKDLPPVEELDMAVTESEVVKIGTITGCVDELVVVESCPGNPAIDLDSVLFLDSGRRPLGRVFDVIGPVSRPLYCVRFNSKEHIREKEVVQGLDVFYAPKSEYTSFVFLDQLMKLKISDASWRDDEEPPPNFLDFSDDEEERQAKQRRNNAKKAESAAGTKVEEVQRKKARVDGSAGQREASQRGRGGGGGHNRNYNQQDGNARYDSQRHDNGLYDRTTNPFYRQARNYNPRSMGPIRWNNYNAPQNLQGPPPPPPPYSNQGGYSGQENPGYYTAPGYNQPRYNQNIHENFHHPRQQIQPSHPPGYYQDSYARNPHNPTNQYNHQQWQDPPPPGNY